MPDPPKTIGRRDNQSEQAQALIRGAIKKEQHFTAMFAARDRKRRELTGQDPFKINPKALKAVAAPIGQADKRRMDSAATAREEANKATLVATLQAASRPPQERTRLPATAAQEIGWDWKSAPAISQPPLTPAYHAMSEILKFAENYSVTMFAGPFDKTQPIARSTESAAPSKAAKK
jgi:hypothetical protein